MTGLADSWQRPINYLRISVTDRCNQRCVYCMPPQGVELLPHEEILSYEEIQTVVRAAAALGISKVRITGGEPLVRADLPQLIQMLAGIESIDDISLTTNGTRLAEYAAELKQTGLQRVNISLDTLRQQRFAQISRGQQRLDDVLRGIAAARSVGLNPVKLNMVVMAGTNDDEIEDFALKSIDDGWHVRFIEPMPLAGNTTAGSPFIPVSEMRRHLSSLGTLESCHPGVGNGPAKYYRFPGAAGTIGFITPVSEHFCFQCNRLRLTSNGRLRPCLLAEDEIDLKLPLRQGLSATRLIPLIEQAIASKPRRHRLTEGTVPQSCFFSQVGG